MCEMVLCVTVVPGVILPPWVNKPKDKKPTHWGWQRGEREWAWIPDDMLIFCKKLGIIHLQNFVMWDNYISSLSKPLLTIILFVRVKYILTGLAYMRDTLQRIWNLQSWELMTEVQIPTPSLRLSGLLEQVLGKRHCAKCMAGTQR